MTRPTQLHYRTVVNGMIEGRVVPLLGAGVNMCDRPKKVRWEHGRYLPDGAELAAYLATSFETPTRELRDLLRVAQYIDVAIGSGPLYDKLHELFDADYPPGRVHELLARFPELVKAGQANRYQLIVTTNYDDALERAFRRAGHDFDVIVYVAGGPDRGKFVHLPPTGDPRSIDKPNEYADVSLDERTIILKLHGAIDRHQPERDSYVITEDDYIDYLTRTDLANLVPVTVAAELPRSHFLFLGYSLRDWNLRVILHRIWGQQARSYKSWAVRRDQDLVEEESWRRRGVDVLHAPLEDYVNALAAHMPKLQPKASLL